MIVRRYCILKILLTDLYALWTSKFVTCIRLVASISVAGVQVCISAHERWWNILTVFVDNLQIFSAIKSISIGNCGAQKLPSIKEPTDNYRFVSKYWRTIVVSKASIESCISKSPNHFLYYFEIMSKLFRNVIQVCCWDTTRIPLNRDSSHVCTFFWNMSAQLSLHCASRCTLARLGETEAWPYPIWNVCDVIPK